MRNEMELVMDAISTNEGLARVAVAAFVAPLNPTLEELADVKTAVSEALVRSHTTWSTWPPPIAKPLTRAITGLGT